MEESKSDQSDEGISQGQTHSLHLLMELQYKRIFKSGTNCIESTEYTRRNEVLPASLVVVKTSVLLPSPNDVLALSMKTYIAKGCNPVILCSNMLGSSVNDVIEG